MTEPSLTFDLDGVIDPETGAPIQEMLFSNTNNSAALTCDGASLVGRGDGLGPAETLTPLAPLALSQNMLTVNVLALAALFSGIDGGTF